MNLIKKLSIFCVMLAIGSGLAFGSTDNSDTHNDAKSLETTETPADDEPTDE